MANITPEWIRKKLLDKNQNPSRMKKKQNLTEEIINAMKEQSKYNRDDLNSLIFCVYHNITSPPKCEHCSGLVKVNKHGTPQRFCSNRCLCSSDFQSEHLSKSMKQNYITKGPEMIRKRKATNLAKYGYENILSIPGMTARVAKGNDKKKENMRKRQEEHLAKFGVLIQQRHWSPEVRIKLNDEKLLNDLYRVQSMNFGEMAKIIGCSVSSVSNKISELGWSRFKITSTGERQIYEYVAGIIPEEKLIRNDRLVFANKLELDIYLPNKKYAVEYNGIFWHSTDAENETARKMKHQKKYLACREKGIKLVQFFEDEWETKSDLCKAMISNSLGFSKRIGARKTTIRELSLLESKEFLEYNHINGSANSSVKLGLFLKDELVQVMTFAKPRFDKSFDFEVIRFATKRGLNIVGGASRLLSHFRKSNKGTIMTYADLRFGSGQVYEKLGFKQIGITQPGYFWLIDDKRISRHKTQKRLLPELLAERYNPELSEDANMFSVGARKIFDAGNAKFSLD